MTGPGGRDGYVSGDGLTRAERRRQTEQAARRARDDRSSAPGRGRAADPTRVATVGDRTADPTRVATAGDRTADSIRAATGRGRSAGSIRAGTGRDRAADMARAATAMARSRRTPRGVVEPVPRQRVRRTTKIPDKSRPLYVRILRLRHLRPGGLACFLLFEGVIALAILLSLAELVSWFSVLVVPAVVAGIVKINDIIAGAFARADSAGRRRPPPRARGVAKVRGIAAVLPIMPRPRDTADTARLVTATGRASARNQGDTVDGPTEVVRTPDRTGNGTPGIAGTAGRTVDGMPEIAEDMQVTRRLTRGSATTNGRRRQSNQRRFSMEMRAEPPPGQW